VHPTAVLKLIQRAADHEVCIQQKQHLQEGSERHFAMLLLGEQEQNCCQSHNNNNNNNNNNDDDIIINTETALQLMMS